MEEYTACHRSLAELRIHEDVIEDKLVPMKCDFSDFVEVTSKKTRRAYKKVSIPEASNQSLDWLRRVLNDRCFKFLQDTFSPKAIVDLWELFELKIHLSDPSNVKERQSYEARISQLRDSVCDDVIFRIIIGDLTNVHIEKIHDMSKDKCFNYNQRTELQFIVTELKNQIIKRAISEAKAFDSIEDASLDCLNDLLAWKLLTKKETKSLQRQIVQVQELYYKNATKGKQPILEAIYSVIDGIRNVLRSPFLKDEERHSLLNFVRETVEETRARYNIATKVYKDNLPFSLETLLQSPILRNSIRLSIMRTVDDQRKLADQSASEDKAKFIRSMRYNTDCLEFVGTNLNAIVGYGNEPKLSAYIEME